MDIVVNWKNKELNVLLLTEKQENECWAYFVPKQLELENNKTILKSLPEKLIELGTLQRWYKKPLLNLIKLIEEKTTMELCISPNDGMVGIYHHLNETNRAINAYNASMEIEMDMYRQKRKREIEANVNEDMLEDYVRKRKAKIIIEIAKKQVVKIFNKK